MSGSVEIENDLGCFDGEHTHFFFPSPPSPPLRWPARTPRRRFAVSLKLFFPETLNNRDQICQRLAWSTLVSYDTTLSIKNWWKSHRLRQINKNGSTITVRRFVYVGAGISTSDNTNLNRGIMWIKSRSRLNRGIPVSLLMGLSHELARRLKSTIKIAITNFLGRVKGKLPFKRRGSYEE